MRAGSQASAGPEAGLGVEIGDLLADRYRVVRHLATGGMAAVFEGVHVVIQRRVAIKVLLPTHAASPEFVTRFRREARAAAHIGHRNVVEVIDYGDTKDGTPFIVMEYLEGKDILSLLGRATPFPVRRAAKILVQVLDALSAAHAGGIIHRDVKPENIIVCRGYGDEDDFVKLADFGIARFHDDDGSRVTRTGFVVGTPAYMAPEQAGGLGPVDERSDVHSAGVVLYEMLSGRLPFVSDSVNAVLVAIATREPPPLASVAPHVPQELCGIVDRALARDRDARFRSAREFRAALVAYLSPPDGHHESTMEVARERAPTLAPPVAFAVLPEPPPPGPDPIPSIATSGRASKDGPHVRRRLLGTAVGTFGAVAVAFLLQGWSSRAEPGAPRKGAVPTDQASAALDAPTDEPTVPEVAREREKARTVGARSPAASRRRPRLPIVDNPYE